jgi:hypothetical protein
MSFKSIFRTTFLKFGTKLSENEFQQRNRNKRGNELTEYILTALS